MDEGQRRDQHATPGVSRREIAWRGDGLRVLPAVPPLPRWADALILALLAGNLLAGIALPPYQRAEAVQISLTRDAGLLLTDPGALLPGSLGGAVPAREEAVRLGYGSLTRYTAAAGWYAVAGRTTPRPVDLTGGGLSARRAVGPSDLTPIRTQDLLAARAGPAVLAALALLMLFGLVRRLLGRPAATFAVLLFGLQPAVLLTGRQVSDAGVTALLGLMAVYVAAGLSARLAAGREPTLGAWLALSVWSGLCLAAGPDAMPYLAGAAALCAGGLVGGQMRRHRDQVAGRPLREFSIGSGAGWLLVSGLGALCVWVLVSPSLWGWLPERLATRRAGQPWLVAQGLLPDPGPGGWDGALGSVRLLVDRPAHLVLTAAALCGVLALGLQLRARRAALAAAGDVTGSGPVRSGAAPAPSVASGRRTATALLVWLGATLAWFVLRPSVQPDHLVPLAAVASVLAGSLLIREGEFTPAR